MLLPKFIRLRTLRNKKYNFVEVETDYGIVFLYDPEKGKRLTVRNVEWRQFCREKKLERSYKKQKETHLLDF